MYMHTLDGKPAFFKDQILFAKNGVKVSSLFVKDLKTIRRNEAASKKMRAERGYENMNTIKIGYLRFRNL